MKKLFLSLIMLFFSASGMYFIEGTEQPEAFHSIRASFWWAVASLTGVGFEEIYPVTLGGKIFGSIISLIGIGVVAVPTGIISASFVELIDEAGLIVQNKPRRAIKVLKEVVVEDEGKFAALTPSKDSVFSGEINFDHPSIGTQTYQTKLLNGNFRHDISRARTFGFLKDVEAMRRNGLALGGSLENAIVLDDKGIMNDKGLRYQDEFIRHKLLDAIGDLYLAGGPIIGTYSADKPASQTIFICSKLCIY